MTTMTDATVTLPFNTEGRQVKIGLAKWEVILLSIAGLILVGSLIWLGMWLKGDNTQRPQQAPQYVPPVVVQPTPVPPVVVQPTPVAPTPTPTGPAASPTPTTPAPAAPAAAPAQSPPAASASPSAPAAGATKAPAPPTAAQNCHKPPAGWAAIYSDQCGYKKP